MSLRAKEDKVVGGSHLLLQLTLLFLEVLFLREHPASAAASGAVHLRIATTGIGTGRPVIASLFGAVGLKLETGGLPADIRP